MYIIHSQNTKQATSQPKEHVHIFILKWDFLDIAWWRRFDSAKAHVALAKAACNDQRVPPIRPTRIRSQKWKNTIAGRWLTNHYAKFHHNNFYWQKIHESITLNGSYMHAHTCRGMLTVICLFHISLPNVKLVAKNRAQNNGEPCHHPWLAWKNWPLAHLFFHSHAMKDSIWYHCTSVRCLAGKLLSTSFVPMIQTKPI